MRILVVGAGFAGAVAARELAERGHQVDVIDRRDHIAGNAYDEVNEHGIRVHRYGPHLFHTSNQRVVDWLSRFTEWTPYEHHILARLPSGDHVPFPPNLNTVDQLGQDNIWPVLFEPYSRRMWGEHFGELHASVLDRVRVRQDRDDRAFRDSFQAMPRDGYTAMFERMLDHDLIRVKLSAAFDHAMEDQYDHVYNSMAIDEYYGYRYGALPYRSLRFHVRHEKTGLPAATVNFTTDSDYTRVTEWQKISGHGNNLDITTLTYEEPCDWQVTGERHYPIITQHNRELYQRYRDISNPRTTFIGRCGGYVYLDMHQVVSSTLSLLTSRNFN